MSEKEEKDLDWLIPIGVGLIGGASLFRWLTQGGFFPAIITILSGSAFLSTIRHGIKSFINWLRR